MPEQGQKQPRISDNYVDGSPYLDKGVDSVARASESSDESYSTLNRALEIAGNSVANHEGLSNRI